MNISNQNKLKTFIEKKLQHKIDNSWKKIFKNKKFGPITTLLIWMTSNSLSISHETINRFWENEVNGYPKNLWKYINKIKLQTSSKSSLVIMFVYGLYYYLSTGSYRDDKNLCPYKEFQFNPLGMLMKYGKCNCSCYTSYIIIMLEYFNLSKYLYPCLSKKHVSLFIIENGENKAYFDKEQYSDYLKDLRDINEINKKEIQEIQENKNSTWFKFFGNKDITITYYVKGIEMSDSCYYSFKNINFSYFNFILQMFAQYDYNQKKNNTQTYYKVLVDYYGLYLYVIDLQLPKKTIYKNIKSKFGTVTTLTESTRMLKSLNKVFSIKNFDLYSDRFEFVRNENYIRELFKKLKELYDNYSSFSLIFYKKYPKNEPFVLTFTKKEDKYFVNNLKFSIIKTNNLFKMLNPENIKINF